MVAAVSDAPFAGRSLHFVGIGGAGMSGLALVAPRARRRGDRLRPRRLAATASALRAAGHRAARSATTPPTCPPGAEVVVSTAIADGQPRAGGRRAAAGAAVLHRGDLLGELSRLKRTIAVERHPRQDHHRLDGRPRAARGRPRPGLPDRRRAALGRHERRLGGGGVGGDRGRRVRPLVPQARAARWRWSPTSSSTTTPPTPRSRELERGLRGVRGAGRGCACWARASSCRARARGARSASRTATCAPSGVELHAAAARASRSRARASSCACPAATTC